MGCHLHSIKNNIETGTVRGRAYSKKVCGKTLVFCGAPFVFVDACGNFGKIVLLCFGNGRILSVDIGG